MKALLVLLCFFLLAAFFFGVPSNATGPLDGRYVYFNREGARHSLVLSRNRYELSLGDNNHAGPVESGLIGRAKNKIILKESSWEFTEPGSNLAMVGLLRMQAPLGYPPFFLKARPEPKTSVPTLPVLAEELTVCSVPLSAKLEAIRMRFGGIQSMDAAPQANYLQYASLSGVGESYEEDALLVGVPKGSSEVEWVSGSVLQAKRSAIVNYQTSHAQIKALFPSAEYSTEDFQDGYLVDLSSAVLMFFWEGRHCRLILAKRASSAIEIFRARHSH